GRLRRTSIIPIRQRRPSSARGTHQGSGTSERYPRHNKSGNSLRNSAAPSKSLATSTVGCFLKFSHAIVSINFVAASSDPGGVPPASIILLKQPSHVVPIVNPQSV